jgi:uncharacterized OB-fold protein
MLAASAAAAVAGNGAPERGGPSGAYLEVDNVSTEPIAEGLFTWPSEEPQLIGNRCTACDAVTFPSRGGCARCGSTDLERHLLGTRGTLWTWTSQGFAPKAPFTGNAGFSDDAVPWYVGLVELPGELRVESLLVGVTQESLEIGMPVRLVVVPFRVDAEGREFMTFAFAPDESDGRSSEREAEKAHV